MKKTLIINIGNSIIHFEEDAFETLTGYLNRIKAHFAHSADNFEIVADIEQRIAEILRERLVVTQSQVVVQEDVALVIAQMGSISDFEAEDEESIQDDSNYKSYKRLFRDTDDVIIAGVCSGLGQYLNIESRWIRLAALLSVFLFGTGFLGYILLWIIMAPANSRAEKMAMRGEPANLQGFKRNYEEELAVFAEQVKKRGAEFEPYFKQTGTAVSEMVGFLGRAIETIAKVFFKIIAIIIIITGSMFMLGLLITLAVTMGLGDTEMFVYFPFSMINQNFRDALLLSAFVTSFVPMLALVLFSIRVAFNKRAINKTLSFALLTIWLCGAGFTAYYTTVIAAEFREYAEIAVPIKIENRKEYRLELNKDMLFSKSDSVQYSLNQSMVGRVMFDADGDSDYYNGTPRNVRILVEKTSAPIVSLNRYDRANGRNFKDALGNTQNIGYTFIEQGDTLNFSPRLQLNKKSNWRAQEVKLVLSVPVGTILIINEDLDRYLDFYSWNCKEQSGYTKWLMTEEGLICQE